MKNFSLETFEKCDNTLELVHASDSAVQYKTLGGKIIVFHFFFALNTVDVQIGDLCASYTFTKEDENILIPRLQVKAEAFNHARYESLETEIEDSLADVRIFKKVAAGEEEIHSIENEARMDEGLPPFDFTQFTFCVTRLKVVHAEAYGDDCLVQFETPEPIERIEFFLSGTRMHVKHQDAKKLIGREISSVMSINDPEHAEIFLEFCRTEKTKYEDRQYETLVDRIDRTLHRPDVEPKKKAPTPMRPTGPRLDVKGEDYEDEEYEHEPKKGGIIEEATESPGFDFLLRCNVCHSQEIESSKKGSMLRCKDCHNKRFTRDVLGQFFDVAKDFGVFKGLR